MTAVHASSLRSTRQPPATSTVLRWELDSGTSTSFLRAHHVSRPSVLGAQADQPGDARINFVLLRPLTLTCSDQLRCTDDPASRLFQLSTSPTFHRTSSRSSLSHTRNTVTTLSHFESFPEAEAATARKGPFNKLQLQSSHPGASRLVEWPCATRFQCEMHRSSLFQRSRSGLHLCTKYGSFKTSTARHRMSGLNWSMEPREGQAEPEGNALEKACARVSAAAAARSFALCLSVHPTLGFTAKIAAIFHCWSKVEFP